MRTWTSPENCNGTELTEDERNTLTHSLRIAAERFDVDAKLCTEKPKPWLDLAAQFTRQAAESRTLADRLDNAEFIRVGNPVETEEADQPEPDHDDSVRCCPDCERPNQFGELCVECERERNAAEEEAR